jgi:2-oxoisovalerate dehydrogenase E1 component beta subunit
VPGLKIVAPSNPYDTKGLLKAAIRDDDPVLFFEHKRLYRRARGDVPSADYVVPIGKASVARKGDDVTVVAYGAMLHSALEAADALALEGVSVEVIDLRTLLPLDKETIFSSVVKTSKVVIAHEDNRTGGIGAEVAAIIADECFGDLDGPITRVAAPDAPAAPYSAPLEEAFLPSVQDVVDAVRRLAAY